jgi:uncharacterized RDD family membrane protein YckC
MSAVSTQVLPTSPSVLPDVDDELVIETPERVELYYTRAQVGNRFLAAVVDHLIQFGIIAGVALSTLAFRQYVQEIWAALGSWAIGAAILLAFFIYSAYFVIFETVWNGQTPGKRIFGLRVIREDGRPVRFYESMVRNVLRTALDSMPFVVAPLYSVGLVAVFLSPRSKRIGDYAAGTVVVREAEGKVATLDDVLALARAEETKTWSRHQTAFVIDAALLEPGDLTALRAYLRRRYDLPDAVRTSLANRIAASLAHKLSVPALPLTADQVLEEIDRQSGSRRGLEDAKA